MKNVSFTVFTVVNNKYITPLVVSGVYDVDKEGASKLDFLLQHLNGNNMSIAEVDIASYIWVRREITDGDLTSTPASADDIRLLKGKINSVDFKSDESFATIICTSEPYKIEVK